VPERNRLEKATDFASGTGVVLELSRLQIGWAATGIAAGAYEACVRYCSERK
jgi:glutaryl-CoA dehydrogenase